MKPTYGGPNLLVISMSKKVNELELNEVFGLLVKVATKQTGDVTHDVKFWFTFLVYKFTAIHFAQGILTTIFT